MRKLIACLVCTLATAGGAAWYLLQPEPQQLTEARAAQVVEAAPLAAPEFLPIPVRESVGPLTMPEGYSGTASVRAGATPAPRTRTLPGWAEGATEQQFPAVVDALAKSHAYGLALHRIYQLADRPKVIEIPTENGVAFVYETRFQREPERMAGLLMAALDKASGVARQNLIFQLAIALPDEVAFPKLREIQSRGDTQDTRDALCALAFRGDEQAMAAFEAMAAEPDPADCNILCDTDGAHDRLAMEGKRDLLRSYRCIEVLDLRPYFHLHSWSFSRGPSWEFGWADRKVMETAAQRRELARRLLPHWIRRYENHPGSDDMAWRLASMCCETEDWFEATQWASRCATYPDQDMTAHGVSLFVTLTECKLEAWQLDDLLGGPEWQRNRELLTHIRLRRMAVEEGFNKALARAEFVARAEPESFTAACFSARWAAAPAKGLTSGLTPLPEHDALLHVEGEMPPARSYMNPVNYWAGSWQHMTSYVGATPDERRLHPPADAVQLPTDRLTRQFRLWETLAELERRRDAATGDDRADIEYKIAAVYYHERDSIHPAYANYRKRNGLPETVAQVEAMDPMRYASRRRAAELFEQLARDYPDWPGRDKALFSAAMAWIKLVDDRTVDYYHDAMRNGTALFERCAAEYPHSTLADDATNAAAYWRRVFPGAWKNDE